MFTHSQHPKNLEHLNTIASSKPNSREILKLKTQWRKKFAWWRTRLRKQRRKSHFPSTDWNKTKSLIISTTFQVLFATNINKKFINSSLKLQNRSELSLRPVRIETQYSHAKRPRNNHATTVKVQQLKKNHQQINREVQWCSYFIQIYTDNLRFVFL